MKKGIAAVGFVFLLATFLFGCSKTGTAVNAFKPEPQNTEIIAKPAGENIVSNNDDMGNNSSQSNNNPKKTDDNNSKTKESPAKTNNAANSNKSTASQKTSTSTKPSIGSSSNALNNGTATIPNIRTSPGNSNQVLVVLTNSYGAVKGTYAAYEKVNNLWKLVSSGSAVVGKKGFSDNKKEGDLTTPTGKYGIPFMFGNASNPGVKYEYRKVTAGDYWVSNNILSEYNVWMHYSGSDAKTRLFDYEELWKQPLYKYAAVIDYNYYSNKILGKGSGIFLHIAPSSGGGTAGCVGVSEKDLVKLLRWFDPAKKPSIIMGVKGHI